MNKPLTEGTWKGGNCTQKKSEPPEGPENDMVCSCGYRAKESVFTIKHKHCPTYLNIWNVWIYNRTEDGMAVTDTDRKEAWQQIKARLFVWVIVGLVVVGFVWRLFSLVS